jgi:hypothetical protein
VFSVASYVEVEHQRAGLDAALELARRFAGSILDPDLDPRRVIPRRDLVSHLQRSVLHSRKCRRRNPDTR